MNGVACPGEGDCWIKLRDGASCHCFLARSPSTTQGLATDPIEMEMSRAPTGLATNKPAMAPSAANRTVTIYEPHSRNRVKQSEARPGVGANRPTQLQRARRESRRATLPIQRKSLGFRPHPLHYRPRESCTDSQAGPLRRARHNPAPARGAHRDARVWLLAPVESFCSPLLQHDLGPRDSGERDGTGCAGDRASLPASMSDDLVFRGIR